VAFVETHATRWAVLVAENPNNDLINRIDNLIHSLCMKMPADGDPEYDVKMQQLARSEEVRQLNMLGWRLPSSVGFPGHIKEHGLMDVVIWAHLLGSATVARALA
jgi:hypothetical protein